MTAHLRETLARLARLGSLPAPPSGKLTRIERACADSALRGDLAGHAAQSRDESWPEIARRIDFLDLAAARPRDIRRAIHEIWDDKARESAAAGLVTHSLGAQRKTYDRELVLAYLRRFPLDHPAFDALDAAAAVAAERHDWPWRERGRRFGLWDADEGPMTLGRALLDADRPSSILQDAGLDGDLATGFFVEEALADACEQAGEARGAEAERLGGRLAVLFQTLAAGGDDAMLVYGLLAPWRDAAPTEAHRKSIAGVLVKRIGDPRLNHARWSAILADLIDDDPQALIAVLRRWLTESTVRAFFAVVGRTTRDAVQWAARERFWLAYLDAGAIGDGWFAFGPAAEHVALSSGIDRSTAFGRIERANGVDPSHSALLMSIGDLKIAEWSHNGACRFWATSDKQAPILYRANYAGGDLKAMFGGRGFEHISHQGRWPDRFAAKIFRETGVTHPIHDRGRDW